MAEESRQLVFFDGGEFSQQKPIAGKTRKAVRSPGRRKAGQPSFSPLRDEQGGCSFCQLDKTCRSPRMEVFGKGNLRFLIVAEAPGKTEDEQGIPLVGDSGQLLKKAFRACDLIMDDDCWRTNIVQCRPPKNRTPTIPEMRNCYGRLRGQIRKLKPDLILTLGGEAAAVILQAPFEVKLMRVRGMLFPSHLWKAWVGCLPHPAFVLHGGMSEQEFIRDLISVLDQYASASVVLPTLKHKRHLVLSNLGLVGAMVDRMIKDGGRIDFDFETTCLSPYASGAEIISCAVTNSLHQAYFISFGAWPGSSRHNMEEQLRKLLTSDLPKSVQNAAFEWAWAREKLGVEIKNIIHDPMIGAHVLDERKLITGLGFQAFRQWGSDYKSQVDRANLQAESEESLARYNSLDALCSFELTEVQQAAMDKPTKEANDFLISCLPALCRMSRTGLQVDMKALKEMQGELESEIEETDAKIRCSTLVKDFIRKRGREFSYDSNKQLQDFLFSYLKLRTVKKTAGGGASVDAAVLDSFVGTSKFNGELSSFCELLLSIKKRKQMVNTYLSGYARLADSNGVLHPEYNLHIARTYRSSASNPNSQNIPHRDPFQVRVRKVFIPRIGDWLLEADYSGAEVRVLAIYSKDRRLIQQILEGYDMHRAWAAKIFQKREEDVTAEQRTDAKTYWVFPILYGAWWKNCMRGFPEVRMPQNFWSGLDLEMRAEFPQVFAWQDGVFEEYQRTGYVQTFLGFRRRAPIDRKEVINMPIQATAFHLLLDAVRKIDAELLKRKMKSRMIAQIHDSILSDVVESELDDVVELIERNMTDIRWSWAGKVPMEVEFEIGRNWLEMKSLERKDRG